MGRRGKIGRGKRSGCRGLGCEGMCLYVDVMRSSIGDALYALDCLARTASCPYFAPSLTPSAPLATSSVFAAMTKSLL